MDDNTEVTCAHCVYFKTRLIQELKHPVLHSPSVLINVCTLHMGTYRMLKDLTICEKFMAQGHYRIEQIRRINNEF